MKRQTRQCSLIFAIAALLFAVTSGGKAVEQTQERVRVKTLSLGIVFQGSKEVIENHFRDFVGYVARKLSPSTEIKSRVVVVPTVWHMAKLLEEKQVDFYMDSPYPTYLINRQGAATLLLRRWKRGAAEYRSILFSKKDGGITHPQELWGKMIAFEDPGSTSGYFLPKVFLLSKGLKLAEKATLEASVAAREVGYIFTDSVEKIVDLVLAKKVAAGAFSNEDYDSLDERKRAEIAVLAETEMFPRHFLSVRKDLNPVLVYQLEEILLSMHQDAGGRKILQKIDNTTKFDILPGGEETVRRKLIEVFGPR